MGLPQVVCLGILLAFSRAQDFPPCSPGTNFLTVASTEDAVALASALKCSHGHFSVDWYGVVVVSETISVTQGTSLEIAGAAPGATADGSHTTNILSVDGGSALHLTDMLVENGNAFAGGAVSATQNSRVTCRGNMTFAANTASLGGAIYAGSSVVVIYGADTVFRGNRASDSGGAIMTEGSSTVSWDGVTTFTNNSANHWGGSVHVRDLSSAYWRGTTTFRDNTASGGGAVYADSSTVTWAGHNTTFHDNHATSHGGAIAAGGSSIISWHDETGFIDTSDSTVGVAVQVLDSSTTPWSN